MRVTTTRPSPTNSHVQRLSSRFIGSSPSHNRNQSPIPTLSYQFARARWPSTLDQFRSFRILIPAMTATVVTAMAEPAYKVEPQQFRERLSKTLPPGSSPVSRTTDVSTGDSKEPDFFWTYTEEPHRTRRQAIISAHPEVHHSLCSSQFLLLFLLHQLTLRFPRYVGHKIVRTRTVD